MTVDLAWNRSGFPTFVECLQALPNLHTLEIDRVDNFAANPLEEALTGVKLPQIKTLILPPTAHPLLQHCRYVEELVCMVRYQTASPDEFLKSLASKRDSRVARLAIPLVTWADPSRKWFGGLSNAITEW